MKNRTHITARIDPETLAILDQMAESLGVSRSALVNDAINMVIDIKESYPKIQETAEAMRTSKGATLEGFFQDYLARVEAIKELNDGHYQGVIPAQTRIERPGEFRLMRGPELFEFLKEYYLRAYKQEQKTREAIEFRMANDIYQP